LRRAVCPDGFGGNPEDTRSAFMKTDLRIMILTTPAFFAVLDVRVEIQVDTGSVSPLK
jgi:hypothetical protein